MEGIPAEDIPPIQEVYIKEEVLDDDVKIEIKAEDENLDDLSPVEGHDDSFTIPSEYEEMYSHIELSGDNEERDDFSSDEQNSSSIEIKAEDENLDEFSHVEGHDDNFTTPSEYDEMCSRMELSGENEDRDDLSSDEQNSNSCSICGKRYLTASSLSAHLSKRHRITLGRRYTCHICGALGQSKSTLKRHLIRTHGVDSVTSPEFMKKCRHCLQALPSQAALHTHISTTHPEEFKKYHCCPKCPGLFSTRPSLIRHFGRIHPGAKFPERDSDQCNKCGIGFKTNTALKKHIKENHPESLVHECQKCKATFKYSYLLNRHTKSAHKERKEAPVKRYYKCEICDREYRFRSRLEKHTKLHTHPEPRVFRCTTCDMTFSSNNLRVRHYRAVHRKKKQPNCSECSKCFETVDELLIHRQEHKINCPVCNKTFLRRDTLREHLLIHNGPRLPCPYCSKTFTQGSNLKRHIRIHTGEKPYKCTFCSKRFGDKSACNSHIRVHTGAERCMCHVCGASFSKRQKLTYHMRKHTGEGLLHCPLCTKPTTNSYALKKHIETHQQSLVKVLNNTGIASVVEDWSEITLTALHNLAHLVAQKCSELTSGRDTEGKKTPESDAKEVHSSDFEMSGEKANSQDIENCRSIFPDEKQEMKKSNSEFETSQNEQSVNGGQNSKTEDTINQKSTIAKNQETLDVGNLSEENYPVHLSPSDKYVSKNEDDELEGKTEDFQPFSNNAHEQIVPMVLQGSPADVLLQLLESIVESHYRTFQTTDVRPTLGDQLVEQCLEVMMHDDTSKLSEDDKTDHNSTHSRCESRISESSDCVDPRELVDISPSETDPLSNSMSNSDVKCPPESSKFDCVGDLPASSINKKGDISSCENKDSTKEMGLFQRELLGDDTRGSSMSQSIETSTDNEHISETLMKLKNGSHEELEAASPDSNNKDLVLKRQNTNSDSLKNIIKVKGECKINKDISIKHSDIVTNGNKIAKGSRNSCTQSKSFHKYDTDAKDAYSQVECKQEVDSGDLFIQNKESMIAKDVQDVCEVIQAVQQPSLSFMKKSRKCFSSSGSVSFKAYIHTNGPTNL